MSTLEKNSVPMSPEEVVQQLRALRDQIPDFVLMPPSVGKPLSRAASVTIEFVHAAINALAASLRLRSALGRDAEALRVETELTARWSQVVDELDALRLGIVGAMRVRRHRVGTVALRVYQVSRNLVLDKENADLLPHIDAMRRAAKFGKRRAPAPSDPAAADKEKEGAATK